MTKDHFESEVETICTKNAGWMRLDIKKFYDKKGPITDHDVVVYQINQERIIICEIQCKREDSSKFLFGRSSTKPTGNYGCFTVNKCTKMPAFIEFDSTEHHIFINWLDGGNPMVDRIDKNPRTQLYCSILDTIKQLDQVRLHKIKRQEILIFPIIVYKTLTSNVFSLRLPFTQKFIDRMRPYVEDNFDGVLSNADLGPTFPLLLVQKTYLKELLPQLETYLTHQIKFS